jgi:DNA polymerase-3 subunit delta
MQLASAQLGAHLQKGLKPLYTIHGDEPLLAQEAADAIRAAARTAGLHRAPGAHRGRRPLRLERACWRRQAMSLFADKQIVEIRIPSGKPGKDGSEALQRYCETAPGNDVVTLLSCPSSTSTQQSSAWFVALDGAGVTVRSTPSSARRCPVDRAAPRAQGQRVKGATKASTRSRSLPTGSKAT